MTGGARDARLGVLMLSTRLAVEDSSAAHAGTRSSEP